MKHVDPHELSGEEEGELRAAFCDDAVDNGEIVDLTDDLLRAAEREEE